MKRILFPILGLLTLLSQSLFADEAPHGSVIELHSCELYAGGCTVSAEAPQGGHYMLRVWDFTGGTFNSTEFKGLRAAALQSSTDNLAARDSKSSEAVIYLPASATKEQRAALLAWLKSNQPDFQPEKIQIRVEPLELTKNDQGYSFSAGQFIRLETRSLEKCDAGSCGEALWYEPRTATSVFTVAVNRTSIVNEPFLKLTWADSAKRSIFLGRFGEPGTSKEIFVTMNEFCGAPDKF